MINFKSVADLLALAEESGKPLGDIVWQWECERSERPPAEVWEDMRQRLLVMRESIEAGLASREKSFSGLVGGEAHRLAASSELLGPTAGLAAAYALAVSEVNASMGKIVACPTAGSCGIVPGAILATASRQRCDDDTLVRTLFTTAGIGEIIATNATVAGAVGGCQAECGSAAGMAAAAVVEMMGGSPRQSVEALALAMKNMLGLACDPVAGLVEVPCVKRNAFAAVHALVAAQMALAGIASVVPADEVIEAMYRIGMAMPCSLKETAEGGLAVTPTGLSITARLLKSSLSK
jgi:L-serine dehydratase